MAAPVSVFLYPASNHTRPRDESSKYDRSMTDADWAFFFVAFLEWKNCLQNTKPRVKRLDTLLRSGVTDICFFLKRFAFLGQHDQSCQRVSPFLVEIDLYSGHKGIRGATPKMDASFLPNPGVIFFKLWLNAENGSLNSLPTGLVSCYHLMIKCQRIR